MEAETLINLTDERTEFEINRQLLLRDAPMGAEPRAQQRPKSFYRVSVDFAKVSVIFVLSIFSSALTNAFGRVASYL